MIWPWQGLSRPQLALGHKSSAKTKTSKRARYPDSRHCTAELSLFSCLISLLLSSFLTRSVLFPLGKILSSAELPPGWMTAGGPHEVAVVMVSLRMISKRHTNFNETGLLRYDYELVFALRHSTGCLHDIDCEEKGGLARIWSDSRTIACMCRLAMGCAE